MTKTIDELYKEMLSCFGQRSGYVPNASCDLAARLYAAAAQIQGLYTQAQWVLEQCFPQSAQGAYLERHAALRGLYRGVATRAAGVLRFGTAEVADTDLTIEAGTVCMTEEGIRFVTTEDAVLSAGSLYADAPALAMEPGRSGNVAPGTVTILSAMPIAIRACTNPDAFSGGDDAESDDSLRRRLLDTYHRLPNGANTAYYEQTALSYAAVAAAQAVCRPRGIGSVDVYVASNAGIPDEELLAEIESYLQEKREISVDLQVLPPTALPVDVAVAIRSADGFSFSAAQAAAEAAIRGAFTGALLGREMTMAQLGNLLYSLDEVSNYRLTAPAADIPAATAVLPTLGSLTITEWEA